MTRKKKARKPRKFETYRNKNSANRCIATDNQNVDVMIDDWLDIKECRRLSAWLTKAADYLEQKETK